MQQEKEMKNTMIDRLANELLDASRKEGLLLRKNEDTRKMMANRAFAEHIIMVIRCRKI